MMYSPKGYMQTTALVRHPLDTHYAQPLTKAHPPDMLPDEDVEVHKAWAWFVSAYDAWLSMSPWKHWLGLFGYRRAKALATDLAYAATMLDDMTHRSRIHKAAFQRLLNNYPRLSSSPENLATILGVIKTAKLQRR